MVHVLPYCPLKKTVFIEDLRNWQIPAALLICVLVFYCVIPSGTPSIILVHRVTGETYCTNKNMLKLRDMS